MAVLQMKSDVSSGGRLLAPAWIYKKLKTAVNSFSENLLLSCYYPLFIACMEVRQTCVYASFSSPMSPAVLSTDLTVTQANISPHQHLSIRCLKSFMWQKHSHSACVILCLLENQLTNHDSLLLSPGKGWPWSRAFSMQVVWNVQHYSTVQTITVCLFSVRWLMPCF